jgi:hypothetical protein
MTMLVSISSMSSRLISANTPSAPSGNGPQTSTFLLTRIIATARSGNLRGCRNRDPPGGDPAIWRAVPAGAYPPPPLGGRPARGRPVAVPVDQEDGGPLGALQVEHLLERRHPEGGQLHRGGAAELLGGHVLHPGDAAERVVHEGEHAGAAAGRALQGARRAAGGVNAG